MRLKLLFSIVLVLGAMITRVSIDENSQVEVEPDYAKWGRLVMQLTKEKYPDTQIVDYLHMGRQPGEEYTTEVFKLWLKGSKREFGVVVNVQFSTQTEEMTKITFTEVDR